MSMTDARRAYMRLAFDAAFQDELVAAASCAERRELFDSKGYAFTTEEWDRVTGEIQSVPRGEDVELSEAELELSVGGARTWYTQVAPAIGGKLRVNLEPEIAMRYGLITPD